MEIIIVSISLLSVIAVALVLARKLCTQKKDIERTKREIELQRYFLSLADVASQHVGREQLEQITSKAQLAIEKAKRLDGFGEYVRPVLQYIIDSTKQLAEGNISAEERDKIGRNIEASSAKLTNIIENMLLMARIDSDNITCNMAVHSMEEIVVPVFEKFSTADREALREVESKGNVEMSIGKGIPMSICCDDIHLTKALTEVVQNALQFTEKGNIQLGWLYRMMTNEVEIFVEDNGIGIKDEYQMRVFEPFFKADPSYSGVGIGLTIAKALIEKMGGKIKIISRGDFGTRISILFQRA